MRIALCLLLLLAGCEKPGRETVRVSSYPGILETFPTYIAQELGYFRESGVSISLVDVSGGSKSMESLIAGSTDVSCDSLIFPQLMAGRNLQVKSFYVTMLRPSMTLAVSPAKSSRIQRVEDLKGALIGVGNFGGAYERGLEFLLLRHRLSLADVKLTTIGVGPSAIAALEHGKVDAGMIPGSLVNILKRRASQTRILLDPRTPEGCLEAFGVDTFPSTAFMATPQWLALHPGSSRNLAKAMRRTITWIKGHSAEEVRALLPERMRGEDAEAHLEALRYIMANLSTDGRMPPDGPETLRKVFFSFPDRPNEAAIDLSKTYTNEFLEAK